MISPSEFTDQELVALLNRGNQIAYTEIYNRYKLLMYTHVYKKLGNREEASDVIQELFTMLWKNHKTIHITSSLSGYLYTAARNSVLNIIEHRGVQSRYVDSLGQFAGSFVAITDHLIREKQMSALIEKEIAALPKKMREVFELSRKSHLSHREIAAQLDISEQTVTKQIKNALKILRTRLGSILFLINFIQF